MFRLPEGGMRPSADQLARTPGGFLTRSDLECLGLSRRAVDATFRNLQVVVLPGYARPMIRVEDFQSYVQEHTYRDDRVRR
jgi:hypothetical protein